MEWVSYAGLPGDRYHDLAQRYMGGKRRPASSRLGCKGGFDRGREVLRRAQALQAAGEHRRRQILGLPSGLHHAPAAHRGPNRPVWA